MTIREQAQERLSGVNSWTIEVAQKAIKTAQISVDYYNSLPIWKQSAHDVQMKLAHSLNEIAVLKEIIVILTEQAEAIVAAEAVQAVVTLSQTYNRTTVMRKVVAVVANKLHKLGFTLSECFTKAWALVKGAMQFIYYNAQAA